MGNILVRLKRSVINFLCTSYIEERFMSPVINLFKNEEVVQKAWIQFDKLQLYSWVPTVTYSKKHQASKTLTLHKQKLLYNSQELGMNIVKC